MNTPPTLLTVYLYLRAWPTYDRDPRPPIGRADAPPTTALRQSAPTTTAEPEASDARVGFPARRRWFRFRFAAELGTRPSRQRAVGGWDCCASIASCRPAEFRACAASPTTDTGSRRRRRHFDSGDKRRRHWSKSCKSGPLDCTADAAKLQNNNNNYVIGPPNSRAKLYAARVSRGSISSRSIYASRARPQQQTRRPWASAYTSKWGQLGGKASQSSFAVTIASRVWRFLSKNAVNRGFFPMKTNISNVNKQTNHLTHNK